VSCPRILDLPCGHGRVLRHLRADFPKAEITACDILKDGVDFCARTFGAVPAYFDPDPGRIELPGTYDLIWCGSLLTHLPESGWDGFLKLFTRHLDPGGVLVFTTHGRWPAGWLRSGAKRNYGLSPEKREEVLSGYDSSGFGFAQYGAGPGYGVAFSSPAWVCGKLAARLPDFRIVSLGEAAWAGHQDVVACVAGPP